MAEHVFEWLNAYLDGELSGWQRRRVEQHLADCPICQAELATLSRLSQIIYEAIREQPLPDDIPTAERFSAQLMLRLPRQPMSPERPRGQEISWLLAPAALLFAWAFIQAVFLLSSGLATASQVGLLGEVGAWLVPAAGDTGTVLGVFRWLGAQPGGTVQQVASISEGLGWNALVQLVIQGGLSLLYLGWLAIWWHHRQPARADFIPTAPHENGS